MRLMCNGVILEGTYSNHGGNAKFTVEDILNLTVNQPCIVVLNNNNGINHTIAGFNKNEIILA